MTLTEFLLARLAEDEEVARAALDHPGDVERVVYLGGSRYTPASDLPDAEVAAIGEWGWTGGPDPDDDEAVRMIRLINAGYVPNPDRPFRISVGGLWDESESDGAAYFIAKIPARAEGVVHHIVRHDPARVLAEVEAKRRIVTACAERIAIADSDSSRKFQWVAQFAEETLWSLAFPWSDHPDFDEAWRP